MTLKNRKMLFLATTARLGLHGGLPKDDQGHDGIEVGAGFAEAAQRMSGDDNRPQKAPADDSNQPEDDAGNDQDDEDQSTDEDDQNQDDTPGSDDGGEGDQGDGEDAARGKRGTAEYIRELKRERRETRSQMQAMQAQIVALTGLVEKGGLPNTQNGSNSEPTREAPNPSDAEKYPLGVLDDRYIEDKIEWAAEQKIAAKLDGERQTEQARRNAAEAETHAMQLREKLDTLIETGSKLFDDYDDIVDAGMRGDWKLTETTFVAASKREHGAEILYNLAKDKKEAARVAALPVDEQAEYVIEKNREIAAKRKPRNKPQAGDPPRNVPGGRSSSNPIRPDTDNLDDFRKVFYAK